MRKTRSSTATTRPVAEWPTLAMLTLCYAVWALGTTQVAALSLPLGIAITALAIALFSSLQHEAIHGHPFGDHRINAGLVFPALTLMIPYIRFRDTHLDHHLDARLTDPYDDPETNYLDPAVWARLPRAVQAVLAFNNTLFGRLTVGVLVSQVAFMLGDARLARQGDRRVTERLAVAPARAGPGGPVAERRAACRSGPICIAAYIGLSLVKIRTFLEHQAHLRASGRTVIIEDRGPLALLFLNNNLHVVHHIHPRLPWYRLPGQYSANRARYVTRNGGYVFASYAQIFRRYLLAAKDPVPHPFWQALTRPCDSGAWTPGYR